MNRDQLTRKLESLDSTPLQATENLLSEIIQLIETAGEDWGAVNWGLLKIAETLTRTKEVDPFEKTKYYEMLFKYVVETALKHNLEVGFDALRYVFDSTSEFYRRNLHDNNVEFPLSKERPIKHYYPAVLEECDAVRPGLTTTARMGWTRCKVLQITQSGAYSIQFFNSNQVYTISDSYWFAPLGERTLDFDWRLNLKVGDLVDALDNRNVWYLSTIVEIKNESNVISVRVSFRYFDEKGDRTDSDGRAFFGWGSNEDDWIDLSSPRIQKPNTMLRSLCYYASTSHNEFVMDDNSDIVYLKEYQEKPFFTMLRSAMTRSQLIYSLWNFFLEQDGVGKVYSMLRAGKSHDAIFNLSIVMALTCFMPPRMAVKQLYAPYLADFIDFLKNNARILNNHRLDMSLWSLEALGKRTLTLGEKHDMIEDLKRFLVPRFLTMNLEKQLLALKCIYDLIKPLRPHTEQSEEQLVEYIKQNNLFYLMYQPNETHEQVLYRSTQFLEYMLKKKIISLKQLDHLWNLFPLNDAKTRVTLQKLISDVLHDMDNEQITYILQRLIDVQAHEFTLDHLRLLDIMKTKNKLEGESYTRALDLLWQLLTIKSATVKAAVETEVEKIFKSFINNIPDERVKFELLNSMLNCLKETTNLQKQPSFLKEYILSYKTQESLQMDQPVTGYPTTRSAVVDYLCQNNVYPICIKHLSKTKIEHKLQEILNLLSSLLQNDLKNDLSLIAKEVYTILGPSQIMLKWLSSLSTHLHKFIQQLFTETTEFQPFSNLSHTSLNSISSMFNDVNAIHGKRRFVKEKLNIEDVAEIEWNSFIYTTCRPEELIGMSFIENILEVPQNPLVYNKIVEFIVKLNVHLDETLFNSIEEIRKGFIDKIVLEFNQINNIGELNDKTKHRLQSRINILNQFVDETEINGLKGVQPYFQILKGDAINIKIQNHVAASKKPKELELFVTDNITLDELREQISEKLEEKKSEIALMKGKRIYEDKFNGRSLADLKITKGDVIRIERAKIPQALKAPLLNESRTALSDKMKEVSKRIYSIYADLEKATVLSKANFFKLCSEIAKADGKEDQAKKIAEQDNSSNKEIKFTQEELDKEFLDRIKVKEESIWKFVESLGIQNDLRVEHKEVTKQLPASAMPRLILSTIPVYDTLLAMLKNPHLSTDHTIIYKLLCSLPIDQRFKHEVFSEWKPQNFNKERSVFEINYILGLTEAELEKSSEEQFSINFARSGIYTLINYLKDHHFDDITKSIYTLNQMEKTVVSLILRILSGYVRIFAQPNAFVSQLYFERINELEIDAFIEKINKKVELNDHDVEYKKKFDNNSVTIPVEEISSIASSILENLIQNYTENYIKEITPEVARLCSILGQSSTDFITVLLRGLKIESINLRRTCTNLMYLISSRNNELLSYMLTQMLQNIPSENKSTAIQYFDLLTKLIELSIKENINTVDLKSLTQQLLNRALEYKSDETRTSVIPDRIILGLLGVANCILSAKPEVAAALTSYKWKLLNRCLFYPDPTDKIQEFTIPENVINTATQPEFFEDYINTKAVATRAMLINVIVNLAKHHEENEPDFLEAVLQPILKQLPEKPKKPNTKGLMVGVQNLGAICYMNSMFQSLNTVGGFRNGISMVNKEESKLIAATQRMLAYLLFSQRQDYTPSAFLQSFRQPINPNIQQDTTEFLNLYFDELENELQTTPYRALLRQLFQGSTIVQMICHNCKNKRERKEEYFCYSVGVREKPTLELALEGMHEGDIINDYMCEVCGVKSDLTKRSVLGDLPNFLFLHLQRIVNLDFYRYTKIHSKCLFPLQLNIEPFTKEGVELRQSVGVQYLKKLPQNEEQNKKFQQLCKHGKPDKSYIYNLKAIIVHSGSAEGGHYYTITKRDGGWAKLDDSKATIFTLEQFEGQCYGGHFTSIGEWNIEESKNAYVLLYEKDQKSLIDLDFSEHPDEVGKLEIELEAATKGIQYDKFKPFNTPALYKEVWMDNHRLMLEGHVFGENCAKDFIKLIENLTQSSNSTKKAELISQVLFRISCWSNEVGNLMNEFEKCNPGYDIFLKYVKDFESITNLVFHNDKNIRAGVSRYLTILVINSIKEEGPVEEIYKLLDFLISKLNTDVAKNWLRIEGYLDFLYNVLVSSTSSETLYNYFLSKNLISVLIDFILEKESPLKISIKKHSMGNKFNNVQFEAGVKIIHWLLERSYYFNGQNDNQVQGSKFHLSDNDVFALSSMNFYSKMIKEGQAVHLIASIIEKFSFENYGFIEAISRILLRLLNDAMQRLSESINIMTCIEKLLLIKDSLWQKKAQFVLGISQPYQISKDNSFPSLDMDRFTYGSVLEDVFPIECVLNLSFISRQRYPEVSLYLVRLMLRVAMSSETATEYFKLQFPPNYMYGTYTDWWNQFVPFAFEIVTTKTIKEEELNNLKIEVNNLLFSWKAKPEILPQQSRVITGKVEKERRTMTSKFDTIAMSFSIFDSFVYSVPSLPSADYQTNAALSKHLTHQRLEDAKDDISSVSNILKFMTTSKPALAITDNLETVSNKAQSGHHFIGPKTKDQVYFDSEKTKGFNLWDDETAQQQEQFEKESKQQQQQQQVGSQEEPVTVMEVEKNPEITDAKPPVQTEPMQVEYRVVDIEEPITQIEYFRKIVLTNHSNQNVWAKITIQNVDYLQQNCLLPHIMSATVLAHKQQTFLLFKLDPSRPFSDFSYNLDVEQSAKKKKRVVGPNFFKIYGDQKQEPIVEMEIEEPKEVPPPDASGGQMGDGGLKLCPICTYGNEPDAEKCEMCESVFM